MAETRRKRIELPSGAAGFEPDTFAALQARLRPIYEDVFFDDTAERTIVVVPSLSLDQDVLAKISGAHHYEERLLCLLLLLRLPRTRIVFLSSQPIPDTIVDYYLHMLPGIPPQHARQRLKMFACHDASSVSLTEKLLARPRLLRRIGDAVGDLGRAHMTCFNVTDDERRLALALDMPIYGCDPELLPIGSKSGSRALFRQAGIELPDGAEGLRDAGDVSEAIAGLKRRRPAIEKAVVKLNEGFSGEGNAVFGFAGAPEGAALERWVRSRLETLAFEAADMDWDLFETKLEAMGGIVEEFVDGPDKCSPSSQFRVDPLGNVQAISTHDQVLGGPNGQIFLGCRFPADESYRLDIQERGLKAARILAQKGVLGRFGIDFISTRHDDGWRHVAIEVNLRKGGTTHTFDTMQYLTEGRYDRETGLFYTQQDEPRYYYASDNVESDAYKGLTPSDLTDIAAMHQLHFDRTTQEGVAFQLIGALSEFGKLGLVCIGKSPERADALYRRTIDVLDEETGR